MTAVTRDLLADQDFPSQTISGHHNDLQWLAVCGHHRTVQARGGECTRVQCTGYSTLTGRGNTSFLFMIMNI